MYLILPHRTAKGEVRKKPGRFVAWCSEDLNWQREGSDAHQLRSTVSPLLDMVK